MLKQLRIVEKRKIDGEKEAEEILREVYTSLAKEEIFCFFYFFVRKGFIFYLRDKNDHKRKLENYLLSYKQSIKRILDFAVNFEKVDLMILSIWRRYIKDNPGASANYWGLITMHLVKSFLENKKICDGVYREAKILCKNEIISDNIDLICTKKPKYDLYECKHKVDTQDKKIIIKIDKLKKIIQKIMEMGYYGEVFLATIDYNKKERIANRIENVLDEKYIINAENIFDITLIR